MNLEELRQAPRALGFDAGMPERLERLIRGGIDRETYSAATYVVMRRGAIATLGALGIAQPEATPPVPVQQDTVFDMASITKCFTATLLLQTVEAGKLHLGQEVRHLVPEADGTPVGSATLRSLATHTSGLPAWKAVGESPDLLADLLSTPLIGAPGGLYTYSDLGYILLGSILERRLQAPLHRLIAERIFAPLGMATASFGPRHADSAKLAATTAPLGDVHDPNARRLGGVAGHAGIFASLHDMVRFGLSLAFPATAHQHGILPVLGPRARLLAATRQTPPDLSGHSIGYFTHPSGYLPSGDLLSAQSYGHTGFTGTSFVIDPELDLVLILLTNRVYYENKNDGAEMLRLRRHFSNLVAGALIG